MSAHHTEIILTLTRFNGLLRTRDVHATGAPRAVLARLTHDGAWSEPVADFTRCLTELSPSMTALLKCPRRAPPA